MILLTGYTGFIKKKTKFNKKQFIGRGFQRFIKIKK